jgi:hypothetical protein
MADLTRERLAELRLEASQNTRPTKPVEWSLTVAEAQALVAMAARCVSEETMRKLAVAIEAQGDPEGDANQCWAEFHQATFADLREAAEALAKEGKP